MRNDLSDSGLGRGIYSLSEVSRYTGIPRARVKRWAGGYSFRAKDGPRRSEPVISRDFPESDGRVQLSFVDMVEIRVLDAFLALGVTWPEVRRASRAAIDLLRTSHPFSSFKFRTDGRAIFAKIHDATGNEVMLRLSERQQVFRQIVEPTLRGLEFSGKQLVRWWPLGSGSRIVIDPARSLGRPIGVQSGIPTEVLAQHAREHSIGRTANWYEVEPIEVRHALAFEQRTAA